MEEGGGRASAEAAAASDAECGLRTIHGREGKLNYEKKKENALFGKGGRISTHATNAPSDLPTEYGYKLRGSALFSSPPPQYGSYPYPPQFPRWYVVGETGVCTRKDVPTL